MTKYAAYVANAHMSIRVTPFFDSIKEAREAGDKTDHFQTVIKECANWKEHMRWNAELVGNYASCPINE